VSKNRCIEKHTRHLYRRRSTFKMKKFYGLKGTQLNVAIAVIAGIDFALFGYDQVWVDRAIPV
jgi:hypothetical protein